MNKEKYQDPTAEYAIAEAEKWERQQKQLEEKHGISPTYWELERLKAGGGTDGQGHSGTIPGDKRGNP